MMTNEERKQWLAERRKGVGGSDVSAILGLNPWKTPLDVYEDKLGKREDDEPSEAAYWGTTIEEIVAKEFSKRTGMKVQRINKILRDGTWKMANIDRAIVDPSVAGRVSVCDDGHTLTTTAILECKTSSAYKASLWGPSRETEIVTDSQERAEHEIPIYYECQCQWYMGRTGAKVCYLAVLIGGNDFRIYQIDRDDDLIAKLDIVCEDFWKNNVLQQREPLPRNTDDVLKLFEQDNGQMKECDNAQATDIGELRTVQAQIKTLKDQEETLKNRLIASIGEAQGLTIAGEKVCTFKTQVSNRFSSADFKKADPETYQKYVKESTTRVFRLS